MTIYALVGALSIVLVSVYLAAVATVRVFRNRTLNWITRALCLVVTWLVPFVGPILTIWVAKEEATQELAASRSMWKRLLIIAAAILVAWIGCFAIGIGAANLGSWAYGGHITEGGDGGCPTLAGLAGLTLMGAFGAPFFVIGIVMFLFGSMFAFKFRRK